MGLSAISLFSGAGGLDLAAKWAGIRTVAYCEWEPFAQAVLIERIKDGGLHDAPIWDDVKTFDGKPFSGKVDFMLGGFPCQDLSSAGIRRGIRGGDRSSLWWEYARIIREVGPRFVFVENVSGLLVAGNLGIVLGDLADLGYDAIWFMLPACSVGAPHERERVFVIAYPSGERGNAWRKAIPKSARDMGELQLPDSKSNWRDLQFDRKDEASIWKVLARPILHRVDDGMAGRVDRLKCCGNGVVPQQAFPLLKACIEASRQMTALDALLRSDIKALAASRIGKEVK